MSDMPGDPNFSRREFVASASVLAATSLASSGTFMAQASTASKPSNLFNEAMSRKLTVSTAASESWPVLTRYDEQHLARISMPIGGIGTGTIGLGGRGDLRDWELVNKPAKGYAPPNTFFALWAKTRKNEAVTRALEGPVDPIWFEGASGATARNHGLPRFRSVNFAAAYPLAQVLLDDDSVPLRVRIEAFNPMIPADADASGIPIVVLRFVLINPSNEAVSAVICGNLENFIGWDGDSGKPKENVNEFRTDGAAGVRGIFFQSKGLDRALPAWGTLALTTTANDITYRTRWADLSWGDTLLDWWDDFSADGNLDERDGKREPPYSSLAARVEVPAGASVPVTFFITWHFPNRMSWTPPHERIGNYYATQYTDAWDVAVKTAPKLAQLERDTVRFVRAVVESDVPAVFKDAALSNVSTLRTQTAFRAEDGRFYGWEGCSDHAGCCHGSCTHVWNYEQATAHLYGSLSRSMREIEFGHATRDSGAMSFRVNLPLAQAQEYKVAAADGQMGTILKLYRDWRLSGEEQMLKRLWPAAKRALSFAWIPGGWDADRDGVMEGCQHNTMDVEYYGPNPEIGVWYLGALRAGAEMATAMGDEAFAATCRDLFERGSKWLDANLFNGEFYIHQIRPPKDTKSIAEGLRAGMGSEDLSDPQLQLGEACLTDQLVGQLMAQVCGLGRLLDEHHVRAALASIVKYNFKPDLTAHFNHFRSYALGGEAGTLVATYPKGNRPRRPFPYCNEIWTGLEYTAAAGMVYEGMLEDAITIATAARDRHDGRKRNPFDEPECGHHYARAMSSWALLLAATGFHYDGVSRALRFARSDRPVTWFWSTGDAWGTAKQNGRMLTLSVLGGQLIVERIEIAGVGAAMPGQPLTMHRDETREFELKE